MSIVLGNMDKWFIIGIFGVEQFATYSVGIFLMTGIMIVPGKVFSIFIQYMKEMYVLDEDIAVNINRSFSINNILVYLLTCLISILHLVPGLIGLFFPKYIDVVLLFDMFLLSALLKYGVTITSNILYLLEKNTVIVSLNIKYFPTVMLMIMSHLFLETQAMIGSKQ